MLSRPSSRLARWWNGQGAIRLEEGDVLTTREKEALPMHVAPTSDLKEQGEYTQARLLLECVIASIWNGLCLLYLLAYPHTDPITSEVLSPRPAFVYILLALVLLPLVIGMCAGADVLNEKPVERNRGSRLKHVGVACGFIVCCAGIWTIVGYVVREQVWWLQLDLGLTTLCLQALLLLQGVRRSDSEAEVEEYEEQLDIHEFLRESSSERFTTITVASPSSGSLL